MVNKLQSKASVKNVIKIAIGELKKKRKKRSRKRVAKPQPAGNQRVQASPSVSGLLQLGREFRDVQLSQKQLTDNINSSLQSETRRRRDQIDDAYRDLRRRITTEQRAREMVQETAERGAQLAINTARALETEGQKGMLGAGLALLGRTVGLGAVKVPKPEGGGATATPQQIVSQGQGVGGGGATTPLDPRVILNRQGLTREGLVRVLERLGEDTSSFYNTNGKLKSTPSKTQLVNMAVSAVEQGSTPTGDLDRYVVDAITKEQNPTPSKQQGSDPNALQEEEEEETEPKRLFY